MKKSHWSGMTFKEYGNFIKQYLESGMKDVAYFKEPAIQRLESKYEIKVNRTKVISFDLWLKGNLE
jgi:hypothetical protein